MKTTTCRTVFALMAAFTFTLGARGGAIYKINNTDSLNATTSWSTTSGAQTPNPGSIASTDIAYFNGETMLGTKTVSLGGDLAIGGMALDWSAATDPGTYSSVTINSGNTLTLNGGTIYGSGKDAAGGSYASAGIVLNRSTGGTLTINCAVAIGASQQWVTSRNLTVGGAVNLGGNTLSLYSAAGTQSLSGVISGTGAIARTGSAGGLVYFSNANTYQGGTTLTTGAICIGNSASLGTGTVTFGGGTLSSWTATGYTLANAVAFTGSGTIGTGSGTGTLTFSGTVNLGGATRTLTASVASAIFNGVVSNGGINKAGAATLTLGNSANTYAGVTQVQGGTVSIVKLANGGVSSSVGASSNAASNLYLNGGTLTYTGSGDSTDRLLSLGAAGVINNNGSGALTFTNAGAITHVNAAARNLTLQGTYTASANTFALQVVDGTAGVSAITTLRIGGGTWNITGNNAHTGGTTILTNTAVLNIGHANALGTGTLTVSGNGSFDNTTGSTLTVANAVDLSSSPTFIGTNNMTINGAVTIKTANRTLTVNANTLTLGGAVGQDASARNLTKAGNGKLVLTGTNTYTGTTIISAGTLQVGDGTTDGSVSTSSGITNNSTLIYNLAGSQTYGNAIGGTGALTKAGGGTLTLSEVNTYTGATTINAGTLEIASAGQLNSGAYAGAISNAGTLKINTSADQVLSGAITGAGGLIKSNAGILTLSNNNSGYTGAVSVDGGTLAFSIGALGTSGAVTMNGGTLKWNGTNTQDISSRLTMVAGTTATLDTNGNNMTFASAIGGGTTGALTKIGGGTLTLTGDNTYTGSTTVSAGTLIVNGSLAGSLTVESTGTFKGTGLITGAATIESGATLSPGNSPGYEEFKAGLTLSPTSTTLFELGGALRCDLENTGDPYYDAIDITGGTFTLDGTVQVVWYNGFTASAGQSFRLFDWTKAAGFSDNEPTLDLSGATFAEGSGLSWNTGSFGTTGTITVIPEPGTVGVVATFLAAALLRRRRFG